jgi:hypothetical protein
MPGLAHIGRSATHEQLRDVALRHLGLGQLEWRLDGAIIRATAGGERTAIHTALADVYIVRDTAHIFWGCPQDDRASMTKAAASGVHVNACVTAIQANERADEGVALDGSRRFSAFRQEKSMARGGAAMTFVRAIQGHETYTSRKRLHVARRLAAPHHLGVAGYLTPWPPTRGIACQTRHAESARP